MKKLLVIAALASLGIFEISADILYRFNTTKNNQVDIQFLNAKGNVAKEISIGTSSNDKTKDFNLTQLFGSNMPTSYKLRIRNCNGTASCWYGPKLISTVGGRYYVNVQPSLTGSAHVERKTLSTDSSNTSSAGQLTVNNSMNKAVNLTIRTSTGQPQLVFVPAGQSQTFSYSGTLQSVGWKAGGLTGTKNPSDISNNTINF